MNEKKYLRQQLKENLSSLSKPLYEDYSHKAAELLYQDNDWLDAKVIGVTISKRPEVDTIPIIKKAWEEGKKVVVPKCYPDEKKMIFRFLSDFSQLESVFYGLLEPIVEKTAEAAPEEIDLLIVPGLGYTMEGYRIGFGGGYYDRYLTSFHGKNLSLAFNLQIIPPFPIEEYDLPISKIITNEKVIKIR